MTPRNPDGGGSITAVMQDLSIGSAGDVGAWFVAPFGFKTFDGSQGAQGRFLNKIVIGICALWKLSLCHQVDQTQMLEECDVAAANGSGQSAKPFMVFLMFLCAQGC